MSATITRWALVLGVGAATIVGVPTAALAQSNSSSTPIDPLVAQVTSVVAGAQSQAGSTVNDVVSSVLGQVGPATGQGMAVVSGATGVLNDTLNGTAGPVIGTVNGLLGLNVGL